MHALLIGATGATGSDLLDLLLKDAQCERVDIFVRRAFNQQHEKLHIHIIDFDKISEWQHLVKGDVLYSCLGTTLKAAGSKEAQWRIDFEYQYEFAKAARENGVPKMVLVSANTADPNSKFFYNKMKGQLEVEVKALEFPQLHIFNPPLLIRNNSDRKVELIVAKIIKGLNKIGILKSQTPLPTKILAKALIQASKIKGVPFSTYKGSAIWNIAKN